MLIKCATDHSHQAVWAFVVRVHHRTVYRSAGVAQTRNAPLEAARSALSWLLAQPAWPPQVALWTCSPLPSAELSHHMALLEAAGCVVTIETLPDFVTEAGALALRTALGLPAPARTGRARLRRRRWVGPSPGATPLFFQVSQTAASTSPSLAFPLPQALRASGLLVICDGGHKRLGGALGLAVYGFVVQKQNDLIHTENGLVCRGPAAGSQMAELGAAVAALRWLTAQPRQRVKLRSDCQSVVDLLTGRRRHRLRRGSAMLVRAAGRLMARLRRCGCHLEIAHLPRKQTKAADKLCRQVYAWPVTQARVRVTSFLRTCTMTSAPRSGGIL
ncbi:MAG TPA: ribonuclease H family protein [Symbiobacteriaceae bacterium]|nr:ribonuclease H family protein [Symbiobacteriaceae bacterium]